VKVSGNTLKAAVVGGIVGVAGTVLVLGATGVLGPGAQPGLTASAVAATETPAKETWVCPMHPDQVSDKAGRCEKCGMKLVKQEAGKGEQWVCPMHPKIVSDKPARCSECGMKLVKKEAPRGQNAPTPPVSGHPGLEGESGDHADHQVAPADKAKPAPEAAPAGKEVWVCPMGHIVTDKPGDCPACGMKLIKQKAGPAKGSTVPGTVHLSAEKQQQIGVRTAPVGYVTLSTAIRAAGKVEADESRVSHVHTKIEGWIEGLRVNTTGQLVRKGQPLLSIYSPDLVAAQEEYLQALAAERLLGQGGLLQGDRGLRAAARGRLRNWDFSESHLEDLERTGVARRAVALHAHQGGVVIEKKAVEGMRVMPGDDLFTIADLSSVWVQAQVYESELPYVKVGGKADVQLEALPGRTFAGRVGFVYPTLDPMTRTAKVRVVLANPGLVLKPEMYAAVTLAAPAQRHLAVPSEAVLDSGQRQVAFVAKPDGYFEPRVLRLGGYRGDQAIVKDGLHPGERVVTSANFLIDSESQLQAAMGQMSGGGAHKH